MSTLKCTDLWHNTVRLKSRYSFWKILQTPIKYSPHIHEHHSPPAQYGMCDQLENPRAGCAAADGPPERHWNSAFPVPHSKILQDVFSFLRLTPRIKPAWRFWQIPATVMEIRQTVSFLMFKRHYDILDKIPIWFKPYDRYVWNQKIMQVRHKLALPMYLLYDY